jgi:hypothetical protein
VEVPEIERDSAPEEQPWQAQKRSRVRDEPGQAPSIERYSAEAEQLWSEQEPAAAL